MDGFFRQESLAVCIYARFELDPQAHQASTDHLLDIYIAGIEEALHSATTVVK
jgi:hypothetical protein